MKRNIINIAIILLISCIGIQTVNAQIFNRIKNRTQQKLERKIEDKIVEEISDEIARRAFIPVEKAVDDMLRESYEEEQKKEGKEVNWERDQSAYSDFLAAMNKNVDLPESYTLDLTLDVETRDYDGTKHDMKMYYSTERGIFAIGQEEKKNEKQLVLIDVDNDVVVLYTTDDKGKQTAQAIPSMMKIGAAFIKEEDLTNGLKISATGKTKKVAGYKCNHYTGDSEDEEMNAYMAEDFPINWKDNFGAYFRQFAPKAYSEYSETMKGMILESESIRKSDNSLKASWKTKKVSKDKFVITNKDWEFRKMVD